MKVSFEDLFNILEQSLINYNTGSVLMLLESQSHFTINESLNCLERLKDYFPENKELANFTDMFSKTGYSFLKNDVALVTSSRHFISLYNNLLKNVNFEINLKEKPSAFIDVFALSSSLISPLGKENVLFNVFVTYFKKKEITPLIKECVLNLKNGNSDLVEFPPQLSSLYFKAIEDLSKKEKTLESKLDILKVGLKTKISLPNNDIDVIHKDGLIKTFNLVSENILNDEPQSYQKVIDCIQSVESYKNDKKYKTFADNFIAEIKRKHSQNEILLIDKIPEGFKPGIAKSRYKQDFFYNSDDILSRFSLNNKNLSIALNTLPFITQSFSNSLNLDSVVEFFDKDSRCLVGFNSLEELIELKPKFNLFSMDVENFILPKIVEILNDVPATDFTKSQNSCKNLAEIVSLEYVKFQEKRQSYLTKNMLDNVLGNENMSNGNEDRNSSDVGFKI